jgi:hypothetical protein
MNTLLKTALRLDENKKVQFLQGLGKIFCQRDYGPLLDHIKGPF